MKKTKHLLRSLVCLCFILSLGAFLSIPAEAGDVIGAKEAILAGVRQEEENIDLRSYDLTAAELETAFEQARYSGEAPWFLDYRYQYTYDVDHPVLALQPQYLDAPEVDRGFYERRMAEILAETVHTGMSQWQIALSIHDYLISHTVYDESLNRTGGYELLAYGTTVCQGYAEIYMDLLNRCGIPCVIVSSERMNHCWNLVKIGENWYHVDVTWDDPVSDRHGLTSHKFFLISDSLISSAEYDHYGWETELVCSNTEWDDGRFWNGISSQICYESNLVSYLRHSSETLHSVYRRDELTGELTVLATVDAGYIDLGAGQLYHYQNDGLSLWNGRLYYSDMERVYRMNPDGTEQTTLYHHNATANGTYIAGSVVKDGLLYLTLSTHEGALSELTVTLGEIPAHTHSYAKTVQEATCTEDGVVMGSCSCGIRYPEETLAATGHRYDGGTVVREPSLNTEGERRFVCSVCGDAYSEPIPKLIAAERLEDVVEEGRDLLPLDWLEDKRVWTVPGILLALIIVGNIGKKSKKG